jgi:putative SOS response-associated peptidase YedK
MCGRYLTPDQAALERYWGLRSPPDFVPSYNVAPSQLAPVVRADDAGQLQMHMLTWGYQPAWAKRAWINARAETVFTVKAFAPSAQKRRCLVPAMGWYEWQGEQAPRQPFVFHLDGFQPFAFAGIWTARETPEGWQRSFAILTTEASGPLREIHHRKPMVLNPSDYSAWLAPTTTPEDAQNILRSDLAGISAYAVSPYVNKPEHNDARCIQPLEETR